MIFWETYLYYVIRTHKTIPTEHYSIINSDNFNEYWNIYCFLSVQIIIKVYTLATVEKLIECRRFKFREAKLRCLPNALFNTVIQYYQHCISVYIYKEEKSRNLVIALLFSATRLPMADVVAEHWYKPFFPLFILFYQFLTKVLDFNIKMFDKILILKKVIIKNTTFFLVSQFADRWTDLKTCFFF